MCWAEAASSSENISIALTFFIALGAPMSFCLTFLLKRMGTSEKVSTPPAMTTSA